MAEAPQVTTLVKIHEGQSIVQKTPQLEKLIEDQSKELIGSRAKAPRSSLKFPQKIVYVKVGKGPDNCFGIHQDFLCSQSPYFKAAFAGNFEEAFTRELILETTEPSVFGLFVEWLYTKEIKETPYNIEAPRYFGDKELPPTSDLIKLWVLAEYLQVPRLQNYTIDLIRRRTERNSWTILALPNAYQLSESNLLRKFFIDQMCWSRITAETLKGIYKRLEPGIVCDLLIAERTKSMDPDQVNPLHDMKNYHVGEKQNTNAK